MQKMETRSQSRSKLLSPASAANADDDDCEKAAAAVDPTTAATAAAALPKSTLAARLEKREAMKRNSMDTNHGCEQESDSASDGCEAEEVNGCGGGDGAPGSDDDDDCDELEGEVEDLKNEDMFARFTSEIVSGKDFPAGEFDSAKPEDDPEYELPPPNQDPFVVGVPSGELSAAVGMLTVVDAVASSSGSSESEGEEEAEEEADPIDPDAVPQPDVSIPGVALGEAAKRFPPFWRTKNRLTNLEAASYKSEEDPTFAPTQSELDRASDDEGVDDSEDNDEDDAEKAKVEEEDDFEISEEEAAALDANNGAVADDLTAVMEDLTIGEEEGKVDMVAVPEEKVCLVEAIEEFDPAGYDESADPDFDPLSVAPADNGNEAGEMDSGSDDEEEGMEQ